MTSPTPAVFQALISAEVTVAPRPRTITKFSPPYIPPATTVTVTDTIAGPYYSEQEALAAIERVRVAENNKAATENKRLYGTNITITTAVVTGRVQVAVVDWQDVDKPVD